MKEPEICNAKITNTFLGIEDHGILTFYLYLEFKSGGCGFGGYSLQGFDKQRNKVTYSGKGLEAIAKILDVVGVNSWEKLKGQYIRVEHTGLGGTVTKIGNLMDEKWFSLKDFFSEKEDREMQRYIHYGHKSFDKDKFKRIENRTMFFKPYGGFWASKVDAEYGWKEWCDGEGYAECDKNNAFVFSLSKTANVLTINSVNDLKNLPKAKQPYGLGGTLFDSNYLDFEKMLADGTDAVEVNISADADLYMALYGWDCDSILIMNPDIIVEQ